MPFTPSHIVAVLPFAKPLRLPFSALAIAAMVPDLPLFLPILNYSWTHSIPGLFVACVPVGLVVFLIYEFLLKQPLIALLPPRYTLRTSAISWQWNQPTVRSILLLLLALVIGAATHIFWDSFTHTGQWGVDRIPALTKTYDMFGVSLAGYKLFQYGSSLLGLPLLALVFVRSLVPVAPQCRAVDHLHTGVRLGLGLVLLAILMVVSVIAVQTSPSLQQAVFIILTRSMTGMVGAIALYAVLYHLGVLTYST